MNLISRNPFIFLISLLLLVTMACQGLTTLQTPAAPVDEDAIVRSVVATVEAQLPDTDRHTRPAAGNTDSNQYPAGSHGFESCKMPWSTSIRR